MKNHGTLIYMEIVGLRILKLSKVSTLLGSLAFIDSPPLLILGNIPCLRSWNLFSRLEQKKNVKLRAKASLRNVVGLFYIIGNTVISNHHY